MDKLQLLIKLYGSLRWNPTERLRSVMRLNKDADWACTNYIVITAVWTHHCIASCSTSTTIEQAQYKAWHASEVEATRQCQAYDSRQKMMWFSRVGGGHNSWGIASAHSGILITSDLKPSLVVTGGWPTALGTFEKLWHYCFNLISQVQPHYFKSCNLFV